MKTRFVSMLLTTNVLISKHGSTTISRWNLCIHWHVYLCTQIWTYWYAIHICLFSKTSENGRKKITWRLMHTSSALESIFRHLFTGVVFMLVLIFFMLSYVTQHKNLQTNIIRKLTYRDDRKSKALGFEHKLIQSPTSDSCRDYIIVHTKLKLES